MLGALCCVSGLSVLCAAGFRAVDTWLWGPWEDDDPEGVQWRLRVATVLVAIGAAVRTVWYAAATAPAAARAAATGGLDGVELALIGLGALAVVSTGAAAVAGVLSIAATRVAERMDAGHAARLRRSALPLAAATLWLVKIGGLLAGPVLVIATIGALACALGSAQLLLASGFDVLAALVAWRGANSAARLTREAWATDPPEDAADAPS